MTKNLLLLVAIPLFIACSKSNTSSDTQKPVINLTSPTSNQVFTSGQTITVAASVTDDDQIQKIQVHVTNKATGADVLHQEDHPGTTLFSLSKTFTAQAGVTYKIEIEADDNAGNEGKVEIQVSVN